jgi:hypothetical protein
MYNLLCKDLLANPCREAAQAGLHVRRSKTWSEAGAVLQRNRMYKLKVKMP